MYVSRRQRYRAQYKKQKLILYTILFLTGIITAGFIFSFAVFAWYAKDLPSPNKLAQTTGFSTVFYDRDGKILYEMYKDKNRVPVAFTQISNSLKNGTIAIEDKNFYKHGAISESGIIRSLLSIIFRGKLQGGSTITQQLIKNVLLDSRRTASRKIREMILAFAVEGKYNKDEILQMYLNEAPYGGSFWGVGSAASGYFGKEPKDLSLTESAILAGLPQNPTYYSPFIGKDDAWQARTRDVLRRMREDGYITADQEKKSLAELQTLKFTTSKISITAPHFVFYVKDLIEKEYGPKLIEDGVKIKTTISLETQKAAEKIAKEEIKNLNGYNVGNAGIVIFDSQTGEILAMVGSYDFNDEDFGKYNVTTAERQPGSTVKPITYALAFEKGYTPSTVIMDTKTVFPVAGNKDYEPVNYDGKFRGPIQLRFALGNSINIPAVKLLAMVGLLKLTAAYSVFATGGIRRDPSAVLEITDFKDKPIYKSVRSSEKRIFTPEISFLISHILSDNNARVDEFGPNSYLHIPGKTVAVKTGTTNDKRDNWTIGYTKSITAGVWVGNNDNSPMNPKIASGVTGASSIWYRLMTELLKKYPDGIPDKPEKIKAVTIDSFLGGLPKDGYPTRSEYFLDSSEPKDISSFYKRLKISKTNGKLANDIEVKNGNYDEKDYIVISENDPVSADGKNRWQEGINVWAQSQPDDKYHAPTETSDVSADSVIVSIKSPSDLSTVSSSFTVTAHITSISPVTQVKIYANGTEVKNIGGNNADISETVSLADGTYDLKVTAGNEKNNSGDATVHIGVNQPWSTPTPTPAPTVAPTSAPTPTPTP
ncbi:penicillin-binding protein [Candidatus Roizmanbacteria bacterium]|nr:penicillin-binding protein [Candidatus Roizmanbacteria bacterium]